MCLRRDWFSSYLEVNGGKVLLGNNISCSVVGIGTVAINMFDGMTRTLKEVRHVLDLKRNRISLGTLDESGYSFKAENGKLTISKCHGCHEESEDKWLVYPRRSHIERFSGIGVKN